MKRFLLTLFAVVCVGSVGAQSLDECRRLAREHYPEITQLSVPAISTFLAKKGRAAPRM